MTLLAILFAITLMTTGGAFLLVQRTLENRDAAKVRDRLAGRERARTSEGKTAGPSLFADESEAGRALLARVLAWINVDESLRRMIEQAGVAWTTGQLLLGMLVSALVAFNVCWYMAPPEIREIAAPIAAGAAALPILYLKRLRARRVAAFEAQFPDALQFIARAMRRHAFSVSLEMLHKEFAQPLAGEFRRAFEEQNLGLPLDTALEKLARRMPLLDVQFFVAAVVLQKRTGGNLAEILDKLSGLIRERFKLRGQIRSISAHGRMSSMVLTAIPIVVGIMMYFVNREHMMFFVHEEIGRWMAGAAAGFVLLGFLIMRQIVKIDV